MLAALPGATGRHVADTGRDDAPPRRRRQRPAQPRSSSIPWPNVKSHRCLPNRRLRSVAALPLGVLAALTARGATRLCARPVEAGGGNRSRRTARTRRWWMSHCHRLASNKVSAMLGGGDDGAPPSQEAGPWPPPGQAPSVIQLLQIRIALSHGRPPSRQAVAMSHRCLERDDDAHEEQERLRLAVTH